MLIIDVPSTIDEKEFGTVIPTEARKYIPVPMNEISLDWWWIQRVTLRAPVLMQQKTKY